MNYWNTKKSLYILKEKFLQLSKQYINYINIFYSRAHQNNEQSKIYINDNNTVNNTPNEYNKNYGNKTKELKQDLFNYEYNYMPNYIIPLNYLHQYQLIYNKDKYQENNSFSQKSTTSDGEYNLNNNLNNSSKAKNINKNKEKNLNMEVCIKQGIKTISDIYNSNLSEKCHLTLACYYHCNLILSTNDEYYLNLKLKDISNNYKMMSKKKKDIIIEKKDKDI